MVIYLRRQDLHAESFYKHRLKRGELLIDSSNFEDIPELQLLHDYERLLRTLTSVFGKAEIKVEVFDKAHFHGGDIYQSFMDASGLPWLESYSIPEKSQNRGMDFNLIELYDEIFSHDLKGKEVFFLARMLEVLGSNKKTPSSSPFSLAQRKAYCEKFKDSNDRVAKDFLGRDSLFSDEFTTPQKTLSEKDIVRLHAEYAVGIHHLWYNFLASGSYGFKFHNWLKIVSYQKKIDSLSGGQKLELFLRKAIHSFGWRFIPKWGTGYELEKQLWDNGDLLTTRFF